MGNPSEKRHVRAWRAAVRVPLEMENQRTMRQLQTRRLKSSRDKTVAENANHHQRQPRVVGTSDGQINVDLEAAGGYDRNYDQLIEEAVRDR